MNHKELPPERLGKLVALAKGGIGGEKETAIRFVKVLCKKYGLDFDSVMGENDFAKREYVIKYTSVESRRLFTQIITRYAYDGDPDVDTFVNRVRKVIIFTTTQEKYIEVLNAVNLLYRAYKKEKKLAKQAFFFGFLEKHDLYSNMSKKGKTPDMSAEERKARRMGSGMADGMDDVHIRKQLK